LAAAGLVCGDFDLVGSAGDGDCVVAVVMEVVAGDGDVVYHSVLAVVGGDDSGRGAPDLVSGDGDVVDLVGIPGERELHAVAVDAAAAGLVADVTDVMDGAVDGVRDKRVVAVGDQALVDGVADNVAEAGVEDVDAVELVVQAAGAGGDV